MAMVLATISSTVLTSETQPKNKDKNLFSNVSLKHVQTINELKQLHCNMMKRDLCRKTSDFNKLISAYAAMGIPESLHYAQNVFELYKLNQGSVGTLFMYNALMRGYALAELGDEAIMTYVEMVEMGIAPDKYSFPFVLSACVKVKAVVEGFQYHGAIIKMGLEEDVFIANSLIHFYMECGKVDLGRKVFDSMLEKNVVSWTSLICGYTRRDCPEQAVSLFFEMVEAGIEPNSMTMVLVISACAKLKDLNLGEKIWNYIDQSSVMPNEHIINALVDMYMKCGAINSASQIFHECAEKNLVLCNTIMSNYVDHGMANEVLLVMNAMLQQGPKPDCVSILSAVSASAQLGDLSFAKCCHGYILRNGMDYRDSICNAMIHMYMKCGKKDMASRVFELMEDKTVVSWNSLVAGLIQNGDVELAWEKFNEMPNKNNVTWNTMIGALIQESMFAEVIDIFRVMQNEGIKIDRITMVGIASACGYLGALDLAKWIYAYIKKSTIGCDMKLGTSLVDMFSRCGDPVSAMHVFDKMKEKDVSAWTAAIGAMAAVGNADHAVHLFNEMLSEGVKPDGIVFVAVLTACSHGGFVEQGWQHFLSMKEVYGICPQIFHYGCMVDLLGRAGLLSDAVDLIKRMPMEPNHVIWGSLLSSCRIHNNIELASSAAQKILELAPENPGVHVLLSNIYASAGKWDGVAKVRLRLNEKGLRKVPGSSLIEVMGTIHEFTSGYDSHSASTQISLMLQEIRLRIGNAGHIPDLSNALFDVDDNEKEYLLSRHSEKQAISYGLLSTSQGTPIRVVKNLRMCSDCHSFAKFVSKVYKRKIIVRDNNRFHLFKEGLCSCKDYW